MKKNHLFGLLSLFTLLFAASCQEEDMAGGQYGDTATATFQVSTPMLATRAVGDGTTATKLYVAVYENQNSSLQGPLEVSLIDEGETVTFNDRVATVNLALAKNKEYSVIFWAETANAEEAMFSIDWQSRELNIKDELKANQESYDAFWAQKTVTLNGAISEKVELKRPFAQLNIGTSDKVAAEAAGIVVGNTQVKTKVFTTFDLQTGEASDEAEVTYTMAAISGIEGETFPADADNQSYLSLNYLLMNTDKSIVDVEFQYQDAEDEDPYTLSFPSVPVQRNYRTNIYGTLLTNSANYTVEIKPGFGNDGKEDVANIVYVTTADEMIAALAADKASIEVRLLNDIELPISKLGQQTPGSGEYKLGNENTDSITFDLNGKKLNITTSYMSAIGAKNADALIIIKNGTMTSTGNSATTWNIYDLIFANCNYAIEDVTFEKPIAFDNAGKEVSVKNVAINEAKALYAMWVCAVGQTVNIDGLTINSGRGIKIDEQYVKEELAKVSLNVKNAKFNTQEKAAIMVKSAAGADITLENIDLTGVKADGFNAVWVDEDSKEHADKVNVTGGFCAVEGDTDAANPFLVEGATVEIPAGTYKFPAEVAKGVTIDCAEGTIFTGTSGLNINGATVIGATFSNESGNAVGGTINGTFKNCTFSGSNAFRYCYAGETTVFEDCVFDGAVYGVHFDGGAHDATFRRCTFSGFNAFGSELTLLTLEDCVFKSTGKSGYNGANLWGTTNIIRTKFIFDGTTSTEWIGLNAAKSGKVITLTDCKLEGTEKSMFEYFANYNSGNKVTIDNVEYVLVDDVAGLNAALAGDVEHIYLAEGSTIEGTFKPRSKKILFSAPTNKATIKGRVNIDNYADGISFENIKFDINDDSKVKNSFTGANYKYPGIVVIYASAASFEGCEFKTDIATGVCGINYGSHVPEKVLTVNNCSFEGDYYAIRSRTLFSVTNSTFNTYTEAGKLAAVFTWGNGEANTEGSSGATSVIFKGNKNLNDNSIRGVEMSSTTFNYCHIHIDVQENMGFDKLEDSVISGLVFTGTTFAEGSETFEF